MSFIVVSICQLRGESGRVVRRVCEPPAKVEERCRFATDN